MKELDPWVFLAVFNEMLGPMLWVVLVGAIGTLAAFVALIVRERRIVSRRLVHAELVGRDRPGGEIRQVEKREAGCVPELVAEVSPVLEAVTDHPGDGLSGVRRKPRAAVLG